MKSKYFAEVVVLEGAIPENTMIEIPALGEEGKKAVVDKFGQTAIIAMFFEIKEVVIDNLVFKSEPHNIHRVEFMDRETFEKLLDAKQHELSDRLGEFLTNVMEQIQQKTEDDGSAPTEIVIPEKHRILH